LALSCFALGFAKALAFAATAPALFANQIAACIGMALRTVRLMGIALTAGFLGTFNIRFRCHLLKMARIGAMPHAAKMV